MNCGLLEDVDFVPQQGGGIQYPMDILARLEVALRGSKEPLTLITTIGGKKSLSPSMEKTCRSGSLNTIDFKSLMEYTQEAGTVIIDDHLLDQEDPLATLRLLRARIGESVDMILLPELVGGNHKWLRESLIMRSMAARFWPDWSTFHKLLLAAKFDQIWRSDPGRDKNGSRLEMISARAGVQRERPMVSVVMPVLNEYATFTESITRVLDKEVTGVDIEVIVVESNSTDGTKDLVAEFVGHERVEVIWQEKAGGKGYAVREGIAAARGDIILIQDADLEYDVNDYDALIEELTTWRSSFVLGSRHSGNWKMRKFNDTPFVASLFNLAHIFFVEFMNVLLGASLKDPFTMYKVFYRDCIYGLEFWCRRFDFDHELVIKLYRKGFHPNEIPVNYQARSYADGKKVSVLRDAIFWILTDIRLAFEPLEKEGRRKI